MAKVTIILVDEEDGRINVNCQIDPPIDLNDPNARATAAQFIGVQMMEYANANFFNPKPSEEVIQ